MRSPFSKSVILIAQTYAKGVGASLEPHDFAACLGHFAREQLAQLLQQPITAEDLMTSSYRQAMQNVLDLLEEDFQDEEGWLEVARRIPVWIRYEVDKLEKQAIQVQEPDQTRGLIREAFICYLRAGLLEMTSEAAQFQRAIVVDLQQYALLIASETEASNRAHQAGADEKLTERFKATAQQKARRAAEAIRRRVVESFARMVDGIVHARVRYQHLKRGVGDKRSEALLNTKCLLYLLGRFQTVAEKTTPKATAP